MHISKRIIFLLIIVLAGFFVYSGCSSSINSVRYSSPRESSQGNDSKGRYNSDYNIESDTVDLASDTSDPDEIPVSSKKIDIASVLKKISKSSDLKNLNSNACTEKDKILMEIIKYMDTPYMYGGSNKNGIDCSAYTQAVFGNALSISLGRSARDQFQEGEVIKDKDQLQFGDLVFFNTRRRVKPGHVGIYIGDNLFAHASSSNGVIVSSLDEAYYQKRYMGARRVADITGPFKITSGN
jgi:cell wall-associated NlpC family hydrolase